MPSSAELRRKVLPRAAGEDLALPGSEAGQLAVPVDGFGQAGQCGDDDGLAVVHGGDRVGQVLQGLGLVDHAVGSGCQTTGEQESPILVGVDQYG